MAMENDQAENQLFPTKGDTPNRTPSEVIPIPYPPVINRRVGELRNPQAL